MNLCSDWLVRREWRRKRGMRRRRRRRRMELSGACKQLLPTSAFTPKTKTNRGNERRRVKRTKETGQMGERK